MNAAELAKDVPEAESMLQIHHERKVSHLKNFICPFFSFVIMKETS